MGTFISKQKEKFFKTIPKNNPKKSNDNQDRHSSLLDLRKINEPPKIITKHASLQQMHSISNYRRVKAIHNFDGIQNDDLKFKEGDILDIIDDSSSNWWLAQNVKTLKRGYIPRNFVIDVNNLIETKEWWFVLNRREAEYLLILSANKVGSYLVRQAKNLTSYALSVKKDISLNICDSVKHYKIEYIDKSYYINENEKFSTLQELLDFYSVNLGLCVLLVKPCCRPKVVIPFKELEVNRKDIQLLEKLGEGQFGEVHKAFFNKKTEVAVKMMKKFLDTTSMNPEEFINEAKIMHKLSHPKLVQLMGVCTKDEPIYIITEFMNGGSLLNHLRNSGKKGLPVSMLIDMSAQIADGMSFLETQTPPFVHRDLRAANVLVSDLYNVKVADFGLAREGIYNAHPDCKFPVKWTAPEAIELLQFTIKSDVWSYAILLYEIFTYGRVPYPGYDNSIILKELLNGYRMPCPTTSNGDCPTEVYDLMLRCWSLDPDDRPSFVQITDFFNVASYNGTF